MITFDELDIKILRENFEDELIKQINLNNVAKIFMYLNDNDIFYAKDLFLSSMDLFLLPCDEFKRRFDNLKTKLGVNYVEELGEDTSKIELMYIE